MKRSKILALLLSFAILLTISPSMTGYVAERAERVRQRNGSHYAGVKHRLAAQTDQNGIKCGQLSADAEQWGVLQINGPIEYKAPTRTKSDYTGLRRQR